MPRTCTVCGHSDRALIDMGLVAGRPLRDIAVRYKLSKTSLARHGDLHLTGTLALARRNESEEERGASLLDDVRALRAKTAALLIRAEEAGDLRTALAGVREARGCLELLARLEPRHENRAPIQLPELSDEDLELDTPSLRQWIALVEVLQDELEKWPSLRNRIADRLEEIIHQGA